MKKRIYLMGTGGQGILTAGSVLAKVAAKTGMEVALTPVYSPAVRGGDSFVEIIVSDIPIDNPFMDTADIVICSAKTDFESMVNYIDEKTEFFFDETVAIPCIPCNCVKYPVKIKNNDICRDSRKIGLIILSFIIQHGFPEFMGSAKNEVIINRFCTENEWETITEMAKQLEKQYLDIKNGFANV